MENGDDEAMRRIAGQELGLTTTALSMLGAFARAQTITDDLVLLKISELGPAIAAKMRDVLDKATDSRRMSLLRAVLADIDSEAPIEALVQTFNTAKKWRDAIAHGGGVGFDIRDEGASAIYPQPVPNREPKFEEAIPEADFRRYISRLSWFWDWVAWEMRTNSKLRNVEQHSMGAAIISVTQRPSDHPPQ